MSHLDYVRVYLDDVVIVSRTLDEHVVHVIKVVETIALYGLKVEDLEL